MTHFQEQFVKNLRFYRKERKISQMAFSEMIELSPNYLNAVENGKNFPSPEVIQRIADALDIMPYELFLESPTKATGQTDQSSPVQELQGLKHYVERELDKITARLSVND
jgi:transcriptional regulator with XRE-family HTH domain